ncbi:MAG: carboxymuconolactone decarboxylase family protein [Thermomicrobiales bacterium]|nr:carboxymuconolactone decarboxylase family protein [Thermomicrobiales bacterium]
MLRSRTASRFLNIFIKEGQHNQRLSDPVLMAPFRKENLDIQKLGESGTIEKSIQEFVKIRASQINGCAFCLSMHHRDALKLGERPDRLATLPAWRECPWYSDRERAALAWTEALTDLAAGNVSDELYEECRTVFSEQEMVDLTTLIIAINSWNRLSIGFGTQPEPFAFDGAQ